MKGKKKILASLLAAAMTISSVGVVQAAEKEPFADVAEDSWYYEYVLYAYENDMVSGTGIIRDTGLECYFEPEEQITRAQFIRILYNKEGEPETELTDLFNDVKEDDWFARAVSWAYKNGIVSGKDGCFDVNAPITRQEMATVLFQYAEYLQHDTAGRAALDAFEDTDRVSDWAVGYMEWAVKYGVMVGDGKYLAPQDTATRAQAVTVIRNFIDIFEWENPITLNADKNTVLLEDDKDICFYAMPQRAPLGELLLYESSDADTPVAVMYDDGQLELHGDDIAGDGVYSAKLTIQATENVALKYVAVTAENVSNTTEINCYMPLSDETISSIADAEEKIADMVNSDEYAEMTVKEKKQAAEKLAEELAESGYINADSIKYNEKGDMLIFEYPGGILGGISVGDFDEMLNGEALVRTGVPKTEIAVLTEDADFEDADKVLILNSFPAFESSQSRIEFRTGFYEEMKNEWTAKGLSVTLDTDVTVEDYMTLGEYDIVCLSTHGSIFPMAAGEVPVICLAERSSAKSDRDYMAMLLDGQIAKVSGCYWILPRFFEKSFASDELDGTFIFSECCEFMGKSGEVNNAMAEALLGCSAEAVIGFHNSVFAEYSREIMKSYVEGLFEGKTVQEAFAEAKEAYGADHKEWYEGKYGEGSYYVTRPVAYPVLKGNAMAKLTEIGISNGGFELYNEEFSTAVPAGWTGEGDVRLLTRLGDVLPYGEESTRMAIITTGIGSRTTSYIGEGTEGSALYQKFFVPEGTTSLSFDYNFISEEPMEWVDSIYDDSFAVQLIEDSVVVKEIKYESINTSAWSSVENIDFAGGDETVYETGWKQATVDISEYAGESLTVRFVIYDMGDSSWDSACVLDNVALN